MTDSPPLPQEPCPECEYLGEARVRMTDASPQKPKRRKLPDLGGGCSVLAEVRHLQPAKLTPEEREALDQWTEDHFADRDRIDGGSHKRAMRYD